MELPIATTDRGRFRGLEGQLPVIRDPRCLHLPSTAGRDAPEDL